MYFARSLLKTVSLRVTVKPRYISRGHTAGKVLPSVLVQKLRMSSNVNAVGRGGSRHLNRLAKAKSPYLLQHAENPVRCISAEILSALFTWIYTRLTGTNGDQKPSKRPNARTSPYFYLLGIRHVTVREFYHSFCQFFDSFIRVSCSRS